MKYLLKTKSCRQKRDPHLGIHQYIMVPQPGFHQIRHCSNLHSQEQRRICFRFVWSLSVFQSHFCLICCLDTVIRETVVFSGHEIILYIASKYGDLLEQATKM